MTKAAYRLGDRQRAVTVAAVALPDGTLRVTLPDGTERVVAARRLPGGVVEIAEGDRVFRVPVARADRGGGVTFGWQGESYAFAPEGAGGRGGTPKQRRTGAMTAPMVGVVAEVLVAEGDPVEAFQPLVVVEAMKVLARVESPHAGTVRAVAVRKGDRVEHGQVLIEVAPLPEEDTAPAS